MVKFNLTTGRPSNPYSSSSKISNLFRIGQSQLVKNKEGSAECGMLEAKTGKRHALYTSKDSGKTPHHHNTINKQSYLEDPGWDQRPSQDRVLDARISSLSRGSVLLAIMHSHTADPRPSEALASRNDRAR